MRKFILFVVFAAVAVAFDLPAADDTKVLARIGDRQFTVADFQRWLEYNPEAGRKSIAGDNKMKANMLNQIITGMVIADLARKEGFDKRPDISEKKELLLNNFLTLEYLDKVVAAGVGASDEEIARYYEDNRESFKNPESVTVRHILIRVKAGASDEEKAEARSRAEGVLRQVREGADFSKLASELSEDEGTKARGGSLGSIRHGRMVPEFEKAAFSLAPGEVSGVVETKFGYHIIRVDDRREASYKPLSDVRDIIDSRLTKDRKREAVDQFVAKAMKEADAEVDIRALVGSDPHFAQ